MKRFISRYLHMRDEAATLKLSIIATVVVALAGVVLGLASGSFSIVFDGVYSLVDAVMSGLSLVVVKLITAYATSQNLSPKLKSRFTMGFWHLEPLVLALNGLLLMGVATYALLNSITSLLAGGREIDFGIALVYAVITVTICLFMAVTETKANRRIGSEFVKLDTRAWIMSGGITGALLVAFGLGLLVQGTRFDWVGPYVDPAVLALVCLVIIPLPFPSVRSALSDMLLLTPSDLKEQVDRVAARVVEEQGFETFRSYVAKVGPQKISSCTLSSSPGLRCVR